MDGRHYNLLVSKGEGLFPVILYFHGSMQNGNNIVRDANLVVPFLQRGYAFVALSALDINYSGGRTGSGWIFEGKRGDRDDFAFARAVPDDVSKRFPIDTGRLLVAGHSNGATFVWYLACTDIDKRLGVFAPISGTPVRNRPKTCTNALPRFDILYTHGVSDPISRPSAMEPPRAGPAGWEQKRRYRLWQSV